MLKVDGRTGVGGARFFASEGRLYGLAWTFSALSAVGILESTERQQSAKSYQSREAFFDP